MLELGGIGPQGIYLGEHAVQGGKHSGRRRWAFTIYDKQNRLLLETGRKLAGHRERLRLKSKGSLA